MTAVNPGFMQGRLSPLIDGKIQAFPTSFWQAEFPLAAELGFDQIEWTLDHIGLMNNPLMSREGRAEIRGLCRRHGIKVTTATLDCVKQVPFYKANGATRHGLLEEFTTVIDACAAAGIKTLVIALVEDASLETVQDEIALKEGLDIVHPVLARNQVRIAFESNFEPDRLATFLASYQDSTYGLTYDIGDSAALGFDPVIDFNIWGERVLHVHIKDRPRGGTTVPFGEGDARFEDVFKCLADQKYQGDYILQPARASDGDHATLLARYREQTIEWISEAQRDKTAA